jgi:hypothetical protein
MAMPPDTNSQQRPPAAVTARLRELAPHLRAGGRPLVFSGSGPGKADAAADLARELGMELHRIDLGQVVSRYVGETERNLTAVFEAAEADGAVLFFDEADALFGRRTEVRDSHDRYANAAVGALLRALETHRGPVVFASTRPLGPELAGAAEVAFPGPPPGLPLTRGQVTGSDDPQGLGRVQVSLPLRGDTLWADVLQPQAAGLVTGDTVLVGFVDEDLAHPVVLGRLGPRA